METGREGTYDFPSFLRNSTADPPWNDVFQPAPTNLDPLQDSWWRFENSLT
jgi:hypothetical protein